MTASWDPPGPAPAEARWSTTLVLSLVLHVAGFGAALGLPRLLPRGSQEPPVYVVDLVSLPAGPVTASPAPAPPPAPKTAAAPPKAEKPIALPERQPKKTPPKKTPAPKEPEKKSEPKTQPVREPAKPAQPPKTGPEGAAASGATAAGTVPGATGDTGTRPGGAGGTGGKATDEYNFYFTLLRRKIDAAWKKPLDPTSQAVGSSATITLTLSSSGRVTRIDLTRPSGFDSLDRSVLRAVQDAEPFPPFPYQLGVDTLTVNFEFVLTP